MRLTVRQLRLLLREAAGQPMKGYEAVNHVQNHLGEFFPGAGPKHLPALIHPETGDGWEGAVPFPPQLQAYLDEIGMDPVEFWDAWDYVQNPEDTLDSWDVDDAPDPEELGDVLKTTAADIEHGVNAPGTRGKKPS